MLISKFDLYNPEWLELVFRDRNKEYGAYYLRQHYAGNMVRAMGIAFFGVAVLFGANAMFRSHPEQVIVTEVPIGPTIVKPPVVEIKDVKPPTPAKPIKIEPPVATTQYVPFVPTTEPVTTDPVPPTGPIGSTTTQGAQGGDNLLPVQPTDGGSGAAPAIDNTVHPNFGLDVMPKI
jgi:protein TonB